MRILVAGGSTNTRKIIRKELGQCAYEVVEAGNGEDALAGVTDVKPDLITLGVDMPGISGFKVCS